MARTIASRTKSYPKVLIFGAPKAGKSLAAGKLAEKYKIIWIDCENGHEVLQQLPEDQQERIQLINLPDTRDYPIAIESILKMLKGKVRICDEHGKVGCKICQKQEHDAAKEGYELDLFTEVDLANVPDDTIVVYDSLTQIVNSCIAQITRGKADDYKLQHDDWAHLGVLLDKMLSTIQQAKYKCVVISHEIEAETEGKKKVLVPVGGTRNASRNVAKYFGNVVYAERKMKKHVFSSSTTDSSTVMAGSRQGVDLVKDKADSLLPIFLAADVANQNITLTPRKKVEKVLESKPEESVVDKPEDKQEETPATQQRATATKESVADRLARLRKK